MYGPLALFLNRYRTLFPYKPPACQVLTAANSDFGLGVENRLKKLASSPGAVNVQVLKLRVPTFSLIFGESQSPSYSPLKVDELSSVLK